MRFSTFSFTHSSHKTFSEEWCLTINRLVRLPASQPTRDGNWTLDVSHHTRRPLPLNHVRPLQVSFKAVSKESRASPSSNGLPHSRPQPPYLKSMSFDAQAGNMPGFGSHFTKWMNLWLVIVISEWWWCNSAVVRRLVGLGNIFVHIDQIISSFPKS